MFRALQLAAKVQELAAEQHKRSAAAPAAPPTAARTPPPAPPRHGGGGGGGSARRGAALGVQASPGGPRALRPGLQPAPSFSFGPPPIGAEDEAVPLVAAHMEVDGPAHAPHAAIAGSDGAVAGVAGLAAVGAPVLSGRSPAMHGRGLPPGDALLAAKAGGARPAWAQGSGPLLRAALGAAASASVPLWQQLWAVCPHALADLLQSPSSAASLHEAAAGGSGLDVASVGGSASGQLPPLPWLASGSAQRGNGAAGATGPASGAGAAAAARCAVRSSLMALAEGGGDGVAPLRAAVAVLQVRAGGRATCGHA